MSKKTIEAIKKSGNEAVIQVKSNQNKLFNEIKIFTEELKLEDKYRQSIKDSHGRTESRQVQVFNVPPFLGEKLDRWRYIKYIVKVTRIRTVFDSKNKIRKPTKEHAYYISTTQLNAKDFCKIIQDHWLIENKVHYVKDVSFKEDASRIRVNPGNFARIRSISLNILRINKVKNIKGERTLNCCNFERVLKYKYLS